MTTNEIIDWRDANGRAELDAALTELTAYARTIDPKAAVSTRVSATNGSRVKAVLLLRTQSDGTQVYDIDIRDA